MTQGYDLLQPRYLLGAVEPVLAVTVAAGREQTDLVVVVQGADGNA